MKQMVGFFTQRRAEVFLIECLNIRVFMGEANGSVGVQIPQLVTPVRSVLDRLSAASGTAAGRP